ncbi:MAG: hypothetical protein WC415_00460 [Patescibacteria group bacterium]|jgi:hypothetical protein
MIYLKQLIIIIPAFAVLLYLTTGYKILRPFRKNQMKELAEKLNLEFVGNEKRSWKERFFSYSVKKNIIRGEYNNKKIEIFDFDSILKNAVNPITNAVMTYYYGKNPVHITYINGKIYKDKYLPYLNINKIEKLIKDEISLTEYDKIFFNKGVFLLTLLTSLCITSVIGYYFYAFYSVSLTKILIFLVPISLIVAYFCYRIAKKSGYKVLIKNDPREVATSKK